MRAIAVFPRSREIKLVDVPEPRGLGPRQVLLRVLEVGICGTDREIASFLYGRPAEGADHFILGHEALAEVEAVGGAVKHLHPGQLVVPIVRLPCEDADCYPCRAGRQDFCVTGRFRERGIAGADGFLVEKTVDDLENLIPLPDALRDVGVLVEPLTIVAKSFAQIRRFTDRLPWDPLHRRALVLGAGPVGLLGAMGAVVDGWETLVYSREPASGDRAALVKAFGARYVSAEDVEPRQLGTVSGPLHVVFEAAGHSPLAFATLEALGPNGIYVLTGIPGQRPPTPIDTDLLMRNIVLNNQLVVGTVNAGRADYAEAIHLLEQFMGVFPQATRQLITGRFPIDQVPALLSGRGGIKNVVRTGTS
jgi:threonine dehydrogenase-like Zn-dependent dehydrogenase